MTHPLNACAATADAVESYIDGRLFDSAGLMYSGIDSQTGMPFAKDFITPAKVPRRAAGAPWEYWSYEDTIMTMGLYLDGLVLKHERTGDMACLEKARKVWNAVRNVYSCSQVHGIGSFLRPYGGFEGMHRFLEPLGTDQASPLFCGLYRYLRHAAPTDREAMRRVMIQTLAWYEAQGFEYFYYKTFIHSWRPGDPNANHATSYFLPAIAWAAREFPEDPRWQRHLDERLGCLTAGAYPIYPRGSHQPTFCWGSDLVVLRELLGPRFEQVFTPARLDEAMDAVTEVLRKYDQPGTTMRACPESGAPSFVASVDPAFDPNQGIGFAYYSTRHHGRSRPRCEIAFLIALACVGHRTDETAALAGELLALWRNVPQDFTAFLAEDYQRIPETAHLYARSVGEQLTQWWRDYWLLCSADRQR